MTVKKNLASLAKGKTKAKTTVAKKNEDAKKVVEDRDLKAKKKVEELLQDIKLTKEEEKKVEIVKDEKGMEWIEEQLQILTERNSVLEKEAEEAKENYKKLFESTQNKSQNSQADANLLKLFDELQNGYLNNSGYIDGRPKFIVHFPAFLNRMIMFFPFLEKYKKY